MTKLILEKGESFDLTYETIQRVLKELFGKQFGSFEEIIKELYKPDNSGVFQLPGTVGFPEKQEVQIDTLPYIINEWPLYGPFTNGLNGIIAKAKVIEQ